MKHKLSCEHEPPKTDGSCKLCFAYLTVPAVRQFFDKGELSKPNAVRPPCVHLGEQTGETVECPSCQGKVKVKLHLCELYGKCSTHKQLEGFACCQTCPDYTTKEPEVIKPIRWAYGVTTCPQRRDDLLPRTLASLKLAGFDRPRLFVDGDVYDADWLAHLPEDCTFRYPPLRAYGNWILGLAELYLRDPRCHRYAMFQDDMICCRNLRAYLDRCAYPKKGYWNLYTFPCNQRLCPGKPGSGERTGWYLSDQMGKGAVALVFDRPTVQALLANPKHAKHMVQRVPDETWGHRKIDGAVSEALNPAHNTTIPGTIREWVHSPSLVQHIGNVSTIQLDNLKGEHPHPQATSFRGEQFDALDLLKENSDAGRPN